MKNERIAVTGTLVIAFVISGFIVRPVVGSNETASIASPTPSPRTKRPKTIQSPKPIQSPKTVRPQSTSPTSSGDQPEMQVTLTTNNQPVKKPKNQDIEVENDETHRTQDSKVREGGVNDSTVPTNRAPSGVLTHNFDKLDVRTVPSKTPAAKPAKRKVRKPRN